MVEVAVLSATRTRLSQYLYDIRPSQADIFNF